MAEEFEDEFEPEATAAERGLPVTGGVPAHGIAELVSQVYDQAPAPLRAKLLECLLRPVGPLALVAIAAGAFGRFLHRLSGDAVPISLDEAARITSSHVLELARYVEQCSPAALLRIGSLIADRPVGFATLSGSALLIALSVWRLNEPRRHE